MARKIVAHEAFWSQLDELRGKSGYNRIRSDLARFLERKREIQGPVSNRDQPMRGKGFPNVNHFQLSKNPDRVLFYQETRDTILLLTFGTHADYKHKGGSPHAQKRTARRIENMLAEDPADAPAWARPRWKTFDHLLESPDLEALSTPEVEQLYAEVRMEMEDPARYREVHGADPEEFGEAALDAFLDAGEQIVDRLQAIMQDRPSPEDILLEQPSAT